MPTLIAIETSSEIASVALLQGERLFVQSANGVQNHSQTVLPMVQALLREANLELKDCAAIAFGAGPGSFTGVRTACGIAQGLAFGAGLPVVPVSTLLAMAEACRQQTGINDILPLLDARMGELYWAQYRFDGAWQVISPPVLTTAQQVQAQGPVQACGNGLALCGEPLWQSLGEGQGAIMPHAAQIARLGRHSLQQGGGLPAAAAQPLYLRNKVAQTTAERTLAREQR
jgi:tRNA threonylcarbamoyladenosine biosynthesis protein TsaB